MKLFNFFERRDMCNVCGQTPCNCTHLNEGIAEGGENWIKLPNGNYRNMHTGVTASRPPKQKRVRGYKWEVNFDYGPHQSTSVTVTASSENEACAKAEKLAEKNGYRSIMINWAKPAEQGVAEETIHVGYRNSSGDWIKTTTHDNYRDAKAAMERLVKRGKKGVQHRYDNKGNIDPGAMMTAKPDSGVAEMDSQGYTGTRDRKRTSKYGSRDHYELGGPESTGRPLTAKQMMDRAHKAMLKSMSNDEKVDKGWRNPNIDEQGVAEGLDPDTTRLEQDVRDALENGDDYTAKQYAKMAPTPEAKKYLLNIIKQAMYIDDLGGETDWKGVAETRKANTASARAEFSKRTRKPTLSPAEQEKKKTDSDEAWARLMAYIEAEKKKEQGLKEFAPGNSDDGEEDNLHKYARMWYNGDEKTQQQVERILARQGWEIGEIESEEGGAFVVQAGDEHGDSYIGFAPEDLTEDMSEGLGKDIDYTSLELDGVHKWDRPDYSDAYFSYGEYIDGTPLPDEVLDQLSSDGDLLRKHIENSLYEGPITPVAPVINPAKVQVQPKQNVYTPSAKGGSGGAVNVGKKSPAAIIDIQTPLVHEDNNDLVDFIFAELEQQFPDVVRKYGHEVVGDAIADTAVFYQDAEDEDIRAMVQQVVNTLQHRSGGQPVQESRLYYNTIGTPSAQLRSTFKMRKDCNGWFLKEDAAPKIKLEALRAFGSPALKEYDLSAFTGGTQTQGPDNVVSPVGSVPKTQRKKVKKNG